MDIRQTTRFPVRGRTRARRLSGIALLALVVADPALATEKPLAEVLPLLPPAVFDNTTDGIEPDELKQLIGKGASANWTLKTASDRKVVISARRPSSEVHLTRKNLDGADIVEALTFNEKAINYGYWAVGAAGAPLSSHQPRGRTRILNETGDGAAIAPADVPVPIRQYIDKMDKCQHWSGEAGDDASPARQHEIAGQLKRLGCATRQRDEKGLKARFADQPRWLGVIARTATILGE